MKQRQVISPHPLLSEKKNIEKKRKERNNKTGHSHALVGSLLEATIGLRVRGKTHLEEIQSKSKIKNLQHKTTSLIEC